MSLDALLADRYSVRAFRPDPVPAEVIRRVLATAQQSASWCNTQPWDVVITETPGATARLREVYMAAATGGQAPHPDWPWPEQYVGAHNERRRKCGFDLYNAVGIARDDKEGRFRQALRNYELFDAPHCMLVFCHESLGFYGGVDCGLFLQAFMLAAWEQGVHSIAQAALAAYPDPIRAHVGFPPEKRLLFGCSFGYADEAHPSNRFRTERADAVNEAVFLR